MDITVNMKRGEMVQCTDRGTTSRDEGQGGTIQESGLIYEDVDMKGGLTREEGQWRGTLRFLFYREGMLFPGK